MHQTFEINLADARKNEKTAEEEYQKLYDAKDEQLTAAQDALKKMDSENGAKGMSREESVDELEALKKQVKDDTRFIEETEASLAQKKKDWKIRSEIRTSELAAISKAISILHND